MISSTVAEALKRVPGLSESPPEDVCVGNVLGGAPASVAARTGVIKGFKKAFGKGKVERRMVGMTKGRSENYSL